MSTPRKRKPLAERLAVARTIRLPLPLLAALDELAVAERRATGSLATWGDVVRRALARDPEITAAMVIREQRTTKSVRETLPLPLPAAPLRRARRVRDET